MPSITFENAAFADVVKKSNSVAANRGEAFEKAAGILIACEEGVQAIATFSSTNLELFYREWVSSLSCDSRIYWRMSAKLLQVIATGLPIGPNRTVTLELVENTGVIKVTSGRMVCTVPLMDEQSYPQWDVFSPDDMTEVSGFAGVIAGVEWAASRNSNPPLCGVHFDGHNVVATDQYRMGIMPLELDVSEPFTVPTSSLTALVKANGGGDAKVAFRDGRLQIMPNQYSQLVLITYGVKYPTYQKILERVGTTTLRVGKTTLLEMLRRTEPMANLDRNPKLSIWIGKGEIAAQGISDKGSALGDAVDVAGFADHPRTKYAFSPEYLISAVDNAPGPELEIAYTPGNSKGFLTIYSEGGYQGWVASRAPEAPQAGGPE